MTPPTDFANPSEENAPIPAPVTTGQAPQAFPPPAVDFACPPPEEAPTRLLLISHAETLHDRYRNLLQRDSGLTAQGWEQAERLARWLSAYQPVDLLASGGNRPSQLTAHRLRQVLGDVPVLRLRLPPLPSQDWALRSPFAQTGAPTPELRQEQEAYMAYLTALVNAVNPLLEKHPGKTVALVADPNAVAILVRHFFGGHRIGLQLRDTSVSEVTCQNGQWRLVAVNRCAHLPHRHATPSPQTSAQASSPISPEEEEAIRRFYDQVAAQLSQAGQQPADNPHLQSFLDFADLAPGLQILEVGSGPGQAVIQLAQSGAKRVVGVDLSPGMLEHAEYLRLSNGAQGQAVQADFRLASAQQLPFQDERFDVVVCRLLLHHLREPERALREFWRVLRPGGVLLLADILGSDDPVKRATHNVIESARNPTHVGIHPAESYRRMLTEAGFALEKEEIRHLERRADDWLDMIVAPEEVREKVLDMLEASIETDAAGLEVRKEEGGLVFTQHILHVKARKPSS